MIEVTRLNGNPMVLNSDLIKTAEASPDTMLTLINGEKLIVRETCAEVMERVLAYRARLLAGWRGSCDSPAPSSRIAALASLDISGQPGLFDQPGSEPCAKVIAGGRLGDRKFRGTWHG